MQKTIRRIIDWNIETLPEVTEALQAVKVREEAKELSEAITELLEVMSEYKVKNGDSGLRELDKKKREVIDEFTDVFIAGVGLLGRFFVADIIGVINRRIDTIEQRVYGLDGRREEN